MTGRLTALDGLPEGVARPGYAPEAHGAGIVHIGLGAFHKAHQAVYTDDALAAQGGDWRMTGVSLRSTGMARALTGQNGLYTVIAHGAGGSSARVIGAIAGAHSMADGRQPVLDALVAEATKIVSLTVTEKGYGINRAAGGVDEAHPAIAADLAHPDAPQGVAGLLVWALGQRRAAGLPPFTVMCCDNLPENGRLVRGLLADYARRVAPELARHIEQEVAFPSTMVDRITPAPGPGTLAEAERMIGRRDEAAVETEAFRQWVIEDAFPQGRPAWEAGGAIFTGDVRPYEAMKLRMLNGAHSMLAYTGFLAGHRFVRDVMGDPALVALIERHLGAAAATLSPLPGVDFAAYSRELLDRFANPHLAHETAQIAMDGTQKLPQRLLEPTLETLRRGGQAEAFAFAVAAWMRYALGRGDGDENHGVQDPRDAEIRAALEDATTAEAVAERLFRLPGLFPAALTDNGAWTGQVTAKLAVMLDRGMRQAIDREAAASAPAAGRT